MSHILSVLSLSIFDKVENLLNMFDKVENLRYKLKVRVFYERKNISVKIS